MTYQVFKDKIGKLAKDSGLSARFSTDSEKGVHTARCSDGTTITATSKGFSVTVRWGSGHMAMAQI